MGIKYEPLSHPPIIKICEWGPWEPKAESCRRKMYQGRVHLLKIYIKLLPLLYTLNNCFLFLQQKQLLGPGTYNITDFIDHMSRKPGSKRGVCETREARFDTTKLVGLL